MIKFLSLTIISLLCLSGVAQAAKADKGHHGILGVVKAVDSDKRTITLETHAKGDKKKEENFVVAKDVSLAAVAIGQHVELKLNKEKTLVEKIEVVGKKK